MSIPEYKYNTALRLTEYQYEYLKTLDNKSDFIRKAIDEAIKKDIK